LNDAEFNMWRDPIAVGCDDDTELTSWKKIRKFKSQWLAGS